LVRLYEVPDNRKLLQVTVEQREELERWAQSRTLPAGDVFRARLILALVDGLSYREIERRLRQRANGIALEAQREEASNRDSQRASACDSADAAQAG